MAEQERKLQLPGRPIRRIREALQGDADTPPELRGGGAARQLPAALGGIGMAAVLGPVGLLAGIAAGLTTRREHRIATEQYSDRERGLRQLNEEFQGRADQLEQQFAPGAEDGDMTGAMNLAQLDEARSRFARGMKLSENFDPELRALGVQMMEQADAGLGGWLEDIETRNEGLINQELGTLRTELKEATDNIRSTDEFITVAHNRFGRMASAWNETSNTGQRRAIFNDFMGRMTEDFGEAAIWQALVRAGVTAGGTLLGFMAGGPAGAAAGAVGGATGAGQVVNAIAKGEIQFTDDEMLRVMTSAHTFNLNDAQKRREEAVRVTEGLVQRARSINPHVTAPSSVFEEYERVPLPTPRNFGAPEVGQGEPGDFEQQRKDVEARWRLRRERQTEETP